jgi:Melibiase
VTDSPNWLTGRRLPLSFRFHVAMAGGLGIGGDLLHWDGDELDEAAALIASYKEIRPVIQRGRLYRIATVDRDPLAPGSTWPRTGRRWCCSAGGAGPVRDEAVAPPGWPASTRPRPTGISRPGRSTAGPA